MDETMPSTKNDGNKGSQRQNGVAPATSKPIPSTTTIGRTTVWLPLMGSLAGMATIAIVYGLTFGHPTHFPHRVRDDGTMVVLVSTPPISLLGCQEPERTAYRVGFTVTGLLLGAVLYQWTRLFYPLLVTHYRYTAWMMRGGAYLAVMGLIGQGLVTLQPDLMQLLQQQQQQQQRAGPLRLSKASIWHQQLAAVFFLGAALHCYATVYYGLSAKNHSCRYTTTSVRIKTVMSALSLVSWPLAEAWHPTRAKGSGAVDWNVAGLAQYIAVGSYICFFGSYALDFAALQRRQQQVQDKTS